MIDIISHYVRLQCESEIFVIRKGENNVSIILI